MLTLFLRNISQTKYKSVSVYGLQICTYNYMYKYFWREKSYQFAPVQHIYFYIYIYAYEHIYITSYMYMATSIYNLVVCKHMKQIEKTSSAFHVHLFLFLCDFCSVPIGFQETLNAIVWVFHLCDSEQIGFGLACCGLVWHWIVTVWLSLASLRSEQHIYRNIFPPTTI